MQTVRVASPVQTVRVVSPVQELRVASPVQLVAPTASTTCQYAPKKLECAAAPKVTPKRKVCKIFLFSECRWESAVMPQFFSSHYFSSIISIIDLIANCILLFSVPCTVAIAWLLRKKNLLLAANNKVPSFNQQHIIRENTQFKHNHIIPAKSSLLSY